jgi:hypothetical protein
MAGLGYYPVVHFEIVIGRVCEPGSSVSSVWLRDIRPGDRGSILGRGEIIVHLTSVSRPTLGLTHPPVFLSNGTGGPFPGAKSRPGSEADHSPLSSAEFE